MNRIKKYDILCAVFDECFFMDDELISINIIMNKNITTRCYLYHLINEMIDDGLLEIVHERHESFIRLTDKGSSKARAYRVLIS